MRKAELPLKEFFCILLIKKGSTSCVIKRKNTTRRNEKISPKTTDITAAEQAEFIFFGEKTVITVKRETILTLCSNIWQNAGNIFVCLPRK